MEDQRDTLFVAHDAVSTDTSTIVEEGKSTCEGRPTGAFWFRM